MNYSTPTEAKQAQAAHKQLKNYLTAAQSQLAQAELLIALNTDIFTNGKYGIVHDLQRILERGIQSLDQE